MWNEPEGGLHGYLVRFLESEDTTFQHIAIWTLVQLLESGGELRFIESLYSILADPSPGAVDTALEEKIRASPKLIPLATHLSTLSAPESVHDSETNGTTSIRGTSDDGTEEGADGGESEIRVLARTVLELLES